MGFKIDMTNFQELMTKELTRKQFLQLLGVMIIGLLGFNNLINMLTHYSRGQANNRAQLQDKNGFGSNKFGV